MVTISIRHPPRPIKSSARVERRSAPPALPGPSRRDSGRRIQGSLPGPDGRSAAPGAASDIDHQARHPGRAGSCRSAPDSARCSAVCGHGHRRRRHRQPDRRTVERARGLGWRRLTTRGPCCSIRTSGSVTRGRPDAVLATDRADLSKRPSSAARCWCRRSRLGIAQLECAPALSSSSDVRTWMARALAFPRGPDSRGCRPRIAIESTRLLSGSPHRDPRTASLIATARLMGAALVTCDARLLGDYAKNRHVKVLDARTRAPGCRRRRSGGSAPARRSCGDRSEATHLGRRADVS